MMKRWLQCASVVMVALAFSVPVWASAPANSLIKWQDWSSQAFEQAKKEKKLVILDLEAVWCHWCHVMDEQTYTNPAVIEDLNNGYISIKVDQDSRPDLSNRYMNYGWPATIIFTPDGKELVKRSGFIEPDEMHKLLARLKAKPVPEEDTDAQPERYSASAYLSKELAATLEQDNTDDYDQKYGAWGIGGHKFMDWDSTEYAMIQDQGPVSIGHKRAIQTLNQQLQLVDPVWGGIYQYSHGGTWTNPHFEKIMSVQAENMRIYALAYAKYHDERYLEAAMSVDRFLTNFLTASNGAFYTSMDADLKQGEHSAEYFQLDDQGRRSLGIPRIDKHIYARENGWAINGLVALYQVTGSETYLKQALKATEVIIAERQISGTGGFRHDAQDKAGPFLGDTLSMGRAFLSLYRATGQRQWLERAQAAADFIDKTFRNVDGKPGYVSGAITQELGAAPPVPLRDENQMLVRFSNLLHHYTAKEEYKAISERAMQFVATPQIARERFAGTTLLADYELKRPPLHITIVGPKMDESAKALYQQAIKYPAIYKRVDWFDRAEGPLPNPDVQYPELEKPAAFVCTANRCSIPIFDPQSLPERIDIISGQAKH